MPTIENKDNLKQILNDPKSMTFLVGNGFNRYVSNASSWADVLKYISTKNCIDNSALHNFTFSSGMSFPEMFSIIEAKHDLEGRNKVDKNKKSLREEIANFLLTKKEIECGFLKFVKEKCSNIITTNFDFRLEECLKINCTKEINSPSNDNVSKSSHYYYLFQYFGKKDGPKVWHIHGHCIRPSSLKLSLSNYTCTLDYIKKKLFVDNDDNKKHISPKDKEGKWIGYSSCLGQFFTDKKLVIIGCGLDSQETLLRELLIYKCRYWEGNEPMGYYLCTTEEIKNNPGKKAFFNALNIQVVEFENYDEIYNGEIWTVNNGNDFSHN